MEGRSDTDEGKGAGDAHDKKHCCFQELCSVSTECSMDVLSKQVLRFKCVIDHV